MGKGKFFLNSKAMLCLVSLFLVLVFSFLSILGENDKAKVAVEKFFGDIKQSNYNSALQFYASDSKHRDLSLNDSMKFHFLLELSLLAHFDLLGEQDYAIHVERESFWLPVFGENEIVLGIALVPEKLGVLTPFMGTSYLPHFITATREDGGWKIKTIDTEQPAIASASETIAAKIDLDAFVTVTDKGFVLHDKSVDVDALSQLERKVIAHGLETAIEKLQF